MRNINRSVLIILVALLALSSVFAATRTFRVQETDFVKITPEAKDADYDKIVYTFTSPLDEKGEWQTNYDDAGEYNIDITASDGKNSTTERVKLLVDKKNQPPYLIEKKLVVQEGKVADLRKLVVDPDHDPLKFTFQVPFSADGTWQTNYDDAGIMTTEFTVSDGEAEITALVELEVLDRNQPQSILKVFNDESYLEVSEGQDLNYYVAANDDDENEIIYSWTLDDKIINTAATGVLNFNYGSAGNHELVVIVSDGTSEVKQSWSLHIADVNRKPVLKADLITVKEGELVKLNLPKEDEDGDKLGYTFSALLDENGMWQTTSVDAGNYNVRVTASDGKTTSSVIISIVVENLDQPPVLDLPVQLEIYEGEHLSWDINAVDPDGSEVQITIDGAPVGANLAGKTFSWNPDYDIIKRSGGMFSNLLNALRLEHFFLKKRTLPLQVQACSAGQCTGGKVDLIVYNVNRQPVLTSSDNLAFQETDQVDLGISAVDPDGDIIRTYYTSPVDSQGRWSTDYADAGEYTSYVTATDGKAGITLPISFSVAKKDRAPRLNIKDDNIVVNEGQQFSFKVDAADPDGDNLSVYLKNLPPGASLQDGIFLWQPSYDLVTAGNSSWLSNLIGESDYLNKKLNDDQAVLYLEFAVDDGVSEIIHPVKVVIKNKNQAPQIIDALPAEELTVPVGKPVIFHAAVKDHDADELNYIWSFTLHEDRIKGTDTIERTFVTPGRKKVKLTVDDGHEKVEKVWTVNVVAGNSAVTALSVAGDDYENNDFRMWAELIES